MWTCTCVWQPPDTRRGCWNPWSWLQEVVSGLIWILETEHQISARAASTLKG